MGKNLDPDNHKSNFSYFSKSYKRADLIIVCVSKALTASNIQTLQHLPRHLVEEFIDRFFLT